MPETYDGIIIGGGPCGAAAARALAQRGWRVALVDKQAFPREKTCGDALLPDALKALQSMGLAADVREVGHAVNGLSVFSPSGREARIAGAFLTLRRGALDGLLFKAAEQAGACALQAEALALVEDEDGVRVDLGAGRCLSARACLLATGADVRLLRAMAPTALAGPTAIASRCYVRSTQPLKRMILTYDRGLGPAYAWIFPMAEGWHNVGVGSLWRPGRMPNHRLLFQRFTQVFPLARNLMAAAIQTSPLRSAPLRCGLDLPSLQPGRRILAAGEAASATFPFTGEGVGKALETGLLAADAVHALLAGDPLGLQGYTRAARGLKPRYQAYQAAHGLVKHPWLMDLAVWRLAQSPWLAECAAAVLSEDQDPRLFFSAFSLLKSFFA